MMNCIKNILARFSKKEPPAPVNDDKDIYPINKNNAFIIYEYGADGLYIHQNKPEEIACSKYAELLFSVNAGQLKTETMECLLESFPKDQAEKIIDDWGGFEIQNQVMKTRADNSRPLIGPRDFFRSINQ